MNFKRTLNSMVAGVVLFSSISCINNVASIDEKDHQLKTKEYSKYVGRIDSPEKSIKFETGKYHYGYKRNMLTKVTDSTLTIYVDDSRNDLKVDRVNFFKIDKKTFKRISGFPTDYNSINGEALMKNYQEEFDSYLIKLENSNKQVK